MEPATRLELVTCWLRISVGNPRWSSALARAHFLGLSGLAWSRRSGCILPCVHHPSTDFGPV